MAAGKPSWLAVTAARDAESALRVGTVGIPNEATSSFDETSSSTARPSLRARAISSSIILHLRRYSIRACRIMYTPPKSEGTSRVELTAVRDLTRSRRHRAAPAQEEPDRAQYPIR